MLSSEGKIKPKRTKFRNSKFKNQQIWSRADKQKKSQKRKKAKKTGYFQKEIYFSSFFFSFAWPKVTFFLVLSFIFPSSFKIR